MQVYDTNNDGVLREDDLREVLKAMIIENGMEFNDEEVQHNPQKGSFPPNLFVHISSKVRHLARILFTDGCKEGRDHLTLEDFKEQLSR